MKIAALFSIFQFFLTQLTVNNNKSIELWKGWSTFKKTLCINVARACYPICSQQRQYYWAMFLESRPLLLMKTCSGLMNLCYVCRVQACCEGHVWSFKKSKQGLSLLPVLRSCKRQTGFACKPIVAEAIQSREKSGLWFSKAYGLISN